MLINSAQGYMIVSLSSTYMKDKFNMESLFVFYTRFLSDQRRYLFILPKLCNSISFGDTSL